MRHIGHSTTIRTVNLIGLISHKVIPGSSIYTSPFTLLSPSHRPNPGVMVGVRTRGPAWALGGAYSPHHSSLLDVLGSEPGGPPLDGPALSVALDVVQAWAVLITVGFTLVLFVFLAFCVCARKDDG